jgi:ATP synthase I chain
MPRDDPAFYERALGRIKLIILILGLAGAVVLAIWKDVRFGGGFLIGAAASYLSFWRWQRVVESIGRSAKARRPPWLLAVRFVVLMAAGYVIIMLTGFNPVAAVIGLLLPGAAVTCEILYELIHGT